MMSRIIALLFLVAAFSTSALASDKEKDCIQNASDIKDKLECIDGLKVDEIPTQTFQGMRQFELRYTQPVDHLNKDSETFDQRLVLLHRSDKDPVVLQTSGYSIFGVRLSSISSMFLTNQLQVEHRFFSKSVPTTMDWSKLNIKQSADDFHRITVAFKQIYSTPWVNTGASKGGMTSVYHRYFYPNDLDGTVADVAPLSFSTTDERYIDFVKNVGGDKYKECREKIFALQKDLLTERNQHVALLDGSFDVLGSADLAFEHSVIEAAFIYWQYTNPESGSVGCEKIPSPGTPSQQMRFLQQVNGISMYEDGDLKSFRPYYFQAATELGNPGNVTEHVQDLRKYEFTIDQYTPNDFEYTYSNEQMKKVEEWAKTKAEKVIYIYGELDPWTAGAFPVRDDTHETFKFTVPGGNHSAQFTLLGSADKKKVIETLSKWLGKKPRLSALSVGSESLEDFEFKVRRSGISGN